MNQKYQTEQIIRKMGKLDAANVQTIRDECARLLGQTNGKSGPPALLRSEQTGLQIAVNRDNPLWQSGYADAQKERDGRFKNSTWPLVLCLVAFENAIARFDQCVIDRGKGMEQQLKKIQSALNDAWVDYKDIMKNERGDDWVEEVILRGQARLNGYHRLLEKDPTAYDDLLKLTEQQESAKPMIEYAQAIARGGPDFENSKSKIILDRTQDILATEQSIPNAFTLARKVAMSLRQDLEQEQREPTEIETKALEWIDSKGATKLNREMKRLCERHGIELPFDKN